MNDASEVDTYPKGNQAPPSNGRSAEYMRTIGTEFDAHRTSGISSSGAGASQDPVGEWVSFTQAMRMSGYKSNASLHGLLERGRIRTRQGTNGCKEYFRPDVEACGQMRGKHCTGRTPGPRGPAGEKQCDISVPHIQPDRSADDFFRTRPQASPASRPSMPTPYAGAQTTTGVSPGGGEFDFNDFLTWVRKGESEGYFTKYEALNAARGVAQE